MKVLLVNPPFTRIRGAGQSAFFPLGLGYLAGTLANEGMEPVIYSAENCRPGEPMPRISMREVFDLRSQGHANFVAALKNDDHYVWQEVREVLRTTAPDVVGITALSVQFGSAAKIAELVKRWRPDCPVVFGGHHCTYMPEDSLRRAPHIDVGVIGEGEETFLELCRAYAKVSSSGGRVAYESIPGLAYRAGDTVQFTERRALLQDLDALPFPRRDAVIFPEGFIPWHFSTLIYGRGCPWACRFCSSQVFWQRRTRYRSPENCLEEIRGLMSTFGLNNFMFWDDAISVRRKNIVDFCDKAMASDLNFSFATATRANLVDDELMLKLKQAGCVELFLGVESGSPRVLKQIAKDLDLDVLRRAVALIRKYNLSLGTFFMAGFPHERLEDLQMTFDLMKELSHARVSFNIFDPMPGSSLYDECTELGLVAKDADWADFPLWPDAYYVTEMTHEEFDIMAHRMAKYIFRRNDSLPARIRRYLPLLMKNPAAFFAKGVEVLGRMVGRQKACPHCPPPKATPPSSPHS